MKPNIGIIISIIALLLSCNNNNQSNKLDRIYFENGQLRREVRIINGLKEGIMTDYYNDGKLRSVRNFVHDIQTGKTTIYHPDGKSVKEVQYYDAKGLRTFGDTLWYSNGQVEFIAEFKNGQKNGMLARFDSLGKLLYKATFLNDTLLKVH